MGLKMNEFLMEFNRNLIAFRRGFLWLLGLLAFAVLGIYYFYSGATSFAGIGFLPDSVYAYIFFDWAYKTGIYQIILILSALLIAEDRENGILKISRSLKLPVLPLILAKYVWMIVYSTIGLLISFVIFSLYLFTSHVPFEFSYLMPFAETFIAYTPISAMIAMQGLTISSMFSKRVTAVIAAIAFFAFVSNVSVFYYNSYVVNISPISALLFNTNFPIFYKIIILMNPIYFRYLSAALLGITMIGMGNNNNGTTSTSQYGFYVPAMFNSYQGYLTVYIVEFFALILLMYIAITLRKRLM